MLMHATLGCCMHHSHSCDHGGVNTESAAPGPCVCGVHTESSDPAAEVDSPDRSGKSDHEGRPCHERRRCNGGKCSFARTESSPDSDSLNREVQPGVALHADRVPQTVTTAVLAASSLPDVLSCTPRLHLVLAVLLI